MRATEFIQRCLDAGMPLDMSLTAAKAFEAEVHLAVEEALEVQRAKARERQAKHRAKSAPEHNGNNVTSRDITLDDVKPVLERDLPCERAQVVTLTSSLRSEAYTPVSPNGLTAPRGAETARGSRIPENWSPVPDYDPAAYGLSHAQHDAELAKFLDYWRSVPGAKGRKTDWTATWRNWMRRASETSPRKAHDRPHDNRQPTARDDRLGRMLSGAMAAADGQAPVLRPGDHGTRPLLPGRTGTGR